MLTRCNLSKEEIRLGVHWQEVKKVQHSFIPRRNFGTAIIDGKIIVIGGYIWTSSREELANDVWVSKDEGKIWEEIKKNNVNPTTTFTKRQKFGTAVIDKDIYIIGGYSDAGSHLNDVWKSSDCGQSWIEVVKHANFTPRYGHKTVVVNKEIYIIGGYDGRQYYNEIWKSNDLGITWTQINNIPFKGRQGFGALNYKDALLIVGGQNREILTDIWISEVPVQIWYKMSNTPFEFFEHEIVEVAGDLFIVERDHVWKSINGGVNWTKILFEAPFGERTGYGMVTIGKKLIILGGRNIKTGAYLNDIWFSSY